MAPQRPTFLVGTLLAGLWTLGACSASPVPSPTLAPTVAATVPPTPSPTDGPSNGPTAAPTPSATPTPSPVADFVVTSPAFADGEPIPVEYTCDGDDLVVPVAWSGAPAGTEELALIFTDPDAGGFVHWVVVGIPGDVTSFAAALPSGAREGRNDFGGTGYRGPCPPANHKYVLTLFALSAPLEVSTDLTAAAVRRAAQDKTLATAELRGTYGPRSR